MSSESPKIEPTLEDLKWYNDRSLWTHIVTLGVGLLVAVGWIGASASTQIINTAPDFLIGLCTTIAGLYGFIVRMIAIYKRNKANEARAKSEQATASKSFPIPDPTRIIDQPTADGSRDRSGSTQTGTGITP